MYVTYNMNKMATAGVPSGTILAVHLQKCWQLSNEIRVMQKILHSKTFMIYFLTFTGKIAKHWFAISLEKKQQQKQGQRKAWRIPSPKNLTLDLWPRKSIGFQIFLRTKYVPSLVKIHWKMLILDCSQGCYRVKIRPCDLWPWKSIGFQTLLSMYQVWTKSIEGCWF